MGIEYELKFRADAEAFQAVIDEYGQGGTVYRMETTYYDTPCGALSARVYTLRRRMENGVSVCTLKTPADGLGRREIEVLCDDIHKALPLLIAQGAPADFAAVIQEGINPICSAAFTRIAVALPYGDSQLELAMDQGTLSGGNRSIPLCEVEVELKSGSREDANRFALALSAIFGLKIEPRSKFRRALALYKGDNV